MKKILFITTLIILLVGCETESSKREELTTSQLQEFNEAGFFNTETVSEYNIANQFLISFYDETKDIDLGLTFYNGTERPDEPITASEEAAILEKMGYENDGQGIPIAVLKLEEHKVSEILEKYTGLTLNETNKKGLDNYMYFDEFDAYYLVRSDSNYIQEVKFTSGYTIGNNTYLIHNHIGTDPNCTEAILTLTKVDDSYQFVSNKCNN